MGLSLRPHQTHSATPLRSLHSALECACTNMYSFMITGWIMLTHVRKCQFSLLHKAATKCVKGRRGLKRLHVQCCVSYHEPFKQHPGNFQLDETESTKCFQFWLPIIFKIIENTFKNSDHSINNDIHNHIRTSLCHRFYKMTQI